MVTMRLLWGDGQFGPLFVFIWVIHSLAMQSAAFLPSSGLALWTRCSRASYPVPSRQVNHSCVRGSERSGAEGADHSAEGPLPRPELDTERVASGEDRASSQARQALRRREDSLFQHAAGGSVASVLQLLSLLSEKFPKG